MRKHKMTAALLALLAMSVTGGMAAYGQDDATVNSPAAVHEQTARHMKEVVKVLNTLGVVETPFDFIMPALSGPVVVLQGFTANGALKSDAEAQVKKLGWVVHVVNEIDYLKSGPELRRVRQQTLGILQKLVPQAFPENHANIRIKVTGEGDITLYGVVEKGSEKMLAAAVEQIKQITFVGSVTNHIVERTE